MQIISAKKCKSENSRSRAQIPQIQLPGFNLYLYFEFGKISGTSFVRRRCIYVGTCLWHVSRTEMIMYL